MFIRREVRVRIVGRFVGVETALVDMFETYTTALSGQPQLTIQHAMMISVNFASLRKQLHMLVQW